MCVCVCVRVCLCACVKTCPKRDSPTVIGPVPDSSWLFSSAFLCQKTTLQLVNKQVHVISLMINISVIEWIQIGLF